MVTTGKILHKGWSRVILNPLAAFVVNSEPHNEARPSVRESVGPDFSRFVDMFNLELPVIATFGLKPNQNFSECAFAHRTLFQKNLTSPCFQS